MATIATANKDLLVVQDLKKYFPVRSGLLQKVTAWVKAVDGVSFTVREGETLRPGGRVGLRQDDHRPDDPAPDPAHRRARSSSTARTCSPRRAPS